MTTFDAGIATDELDAYLSQELPEEVVELEVLNDSLNLMAVLSTRESGRTYVLRRPRKLRRTYFFNSLDREYELLHRLEDTAIPTQTPVLFCDDESVLGAPFYLSTYLEGATVPNGSDLPERFRNADARTSVGCQLVDTLAEIHTQNVDMLEGVCDHQTTLDHVERATDRLDEATSVTDHEIDGLRAVAEWLRENVPSPSRTGLVHGDYRSGNVLVAGTDRPELTGVLDWDTTYLGDPLAELGYFLLYWHDTDDPALSLAELEARYADEAVLADLRTINQYGLCPFTTKSGSPSRSELVDRYEAHTGIAFENQRFYRTHAALMLATVWEDLHRHRVEAGEASDWEPYIDYLSLVATAIIDGEL